MIGVMHELNIRGVPVSFPFEPYQCQVDYMDRVILALEKVRSYSDKYTLLNFWRQTPRVKMRYWSHRLVQERRCVYYAPQ